MINTKIKEKLLTTVLLGKPGRFERSSLDELFAANIFLRQVQPSFGLAIQQEQVSVWFRTRCKPLPFSIYSSTHSLDNRQQPANFRPLSNKGSRIIRHDMMHRTYSSFGPGPRYAVSSEAAATASAVSPTA